MRTGISGTTSYVHLVEPNRNWYRNKRIIILNFWILLLLLTSSTDAYNGRIINSFQSDLPQWRQYFNNPTGGRLNTLKIIQTIGSLVALPMSPYVADNLGRRTSIFIGGLIICIATVGQTVADSLVMFMCACFLTGVGLTFAVTAAPVLVTEIAYPAYRAPLTTAYSSLWYSGAIAAALSTFGTAKFQTTWSWRLPLIFRSIPSALQMALIWFGPESPRWLISKNRNAEALKTLAYYHADSNEDDPLVRFEYDKIKAVIDREVAARVGWKTLFTTPGCRRRLIVLSFLAIALPWHAYPLKYALMAAGITNPNKQFLLSSILQSWNLFWALLAASLVDKVGRRTLFLTSVAGMVVFFSLQTACSTAYTETGQQAAAHAFIAFIFLFYSFYSLAFPTLLISYSIEILPYSLRAKGLTIYYFFAYLAFIFNQYVHPAIGLGPFYWNIVYVVVLTTQGFFLSYFIIETKNRTLEESGTLFDGDSIIEPDVFSTSNITHNGEEDKKSSRFHV